MSETKQLFDLLHEGLTPYQKELHMPTGDPEQPTDPKNCVHTPFLNSPAKATWYFQPIEKVDGTPSGIGYMAAKYTIAGAPHHGVQYSYTGQVLPVVKANEGFLVRWKEFPALNQIVKAELLFNKTPLQQLDNATLNMLTRFMEVPTPGTDADHGNRSDLQTWSDKLPSRPLEFIIPWFYSQEFSKFFPTYLCGANDTLEIVITYRLNIGELLLVKEAESGKMVPLSDRTAEVVGHPFDLKGIANLQHPQLNTSFLYQSYLEADETRCTPDRDVVHVDNFYAFDSDKSYPLGEKITIDFKKLEYPIHTIYWMVENQTAQLGNCSTNALDAKKGEDPIKSVTITHSKLNLVAGLEYLRSHMKKHFRTVPLDAGYGAWSMGVIASDISPHPDIDLSDGSLTIQLKTNDEANPYLGAAETVPCTDKFRLKVRLVYTKIGKFTKKVSSEETRDTERATFKFLTFDERSHPKREPGETTSK